MEEGNLPSEIAIEPKEQARLSQQSYDTSPVNKQGKGITFSGVTQDTENSSSQNSRSTYKEVLSQPAPNISHRQRLLWLQKRRTAGLWVQCDECDRWRFLPQVVDAHELPSKWRCSMNPDKNASDCSVPEAPLRLREEEDLIHSAYAAGSLVWARLAGWPRWPAMVDDCPDTEQYYWLDGFSDIPTHYNVVFFDALDATRAWITPENLTPFITNQRTPGNLPKDKKYKRRMEVAISQAEDAANLTLPQRLAKYSFIARFPGPIKKPKKISKNELKKFQNKLKRKYNIEFDNESGSSEDEVDYVEKDQTTNVIKKKTVSTVTAKKTKERIINKTQPGIKETVKEPFQDSLLGNELNTDIIENTPNETDTTTQSKDPVDVTFKQPNSLAVQAGSTLASTVVDTPFDNDTSATYLPEDAREHENFDETLNTTVQSIQQRAPSSASDDFDF